MYGFHLVFVALLTGQAVGNDCKTEATNVLNEWSKNLTIAGNNFDENYIRYHYNFTEHNRKIYFLKYFNKRIKMVKDGHVNIRPYLSCELSEKVHRHLLNIEHLQAIHNREIYNIETRFYNQRNSLIKNTTVCIVDGESCMTANRDVNSSDVETRKEIWIKSRVVIRRALKGPFIKYVQENKKKYSALDYKYSPNTFFFDVYNITRTELKEIAEGIMPMYIQLNSFRRNRMKLVYKEKHFPYTGHIPAHLLEDLVGGSFKIDNIRPFNTFLFKNVTDALNWQNYTQKDIYIIVDDFYKSLGMPRLPQNFADNSIFTAPEDGRITAEFAYHYMNKTGVIHIGNTSYGYLRYAFYNVGMIQQNIADSIHPPVTISAPHYVFQDAIRLAIFQLTKSPKLLNRLGLLQNPYFDNETEINVLMGFAAKDTDIVYSYVLVEWMAGVVSGEIPPEKYNEKWWELRCKYQGISPPVNRDSSDFDPGRHIDQVWRNDISREIMKTAWKYQILEAACKAASHTGPLYLCDIYGSKAAGSLLLKMMSCDRSKSVSELLKELTGVGKLSFKPLMNYMKPLLEFLKKENENNCEDLGWTNKCPYFD